MATAPSFYLIGTKYGRSQDVLPQMILDGVVSTGFVDHLDLSQIVGKGYVAARHWIEGRIPQESGIAKNTLARLAAMKPGDLVALKAHSAPHGDKPRLVIARYAVVSGVAKAIYARSEALGHTLKVDFLDEQEPIEFALGYGQTLHAIEDHERIELIFGKYAESARVAAAETAKAEDKATHTSVIAARGAYLMHRTHNELQNELRELLIAQYGKSAVKQEENFVDILVYLAHKTLLFEVKSSPSPISCVREALGQLLHYSWKRGLQGNGVRYVVVGPSLASAEDTAFLNHVATETKIALLYCTPKTFESSDV